VRFVVSFYLFFVFCRLPIWGFIGHQRKRENRPHLGQNPRIRPLLTNSRSEDASKLPDLIDIHLHLPAGAQKKTPIAGIAMVVAFVSLLTGACVSKDIAMTGEWVLLVVPCVFLREDGADFLFTRSLSWTRYPCGWDQREGCFSCSVLGYYS